MADHATTEQMPGTFEDFGLGNAEMFELRNYQAALDFAKGKGISEEKLQRAVRKAVVQVGTRSLAVRSKSSS